MALPPHYPSSSYIHQNDYDSSNFNDDLPQFSYSNSTCCTSNTQPELSSTISALKDLIQLSESAISSISASLLASNAPNDSLLSYCPFNYQHRLPPESLFSHCLSCPSSSYNIDRSVLDSLRYPKTLQPDSDLSEQSGSSLSHDFDAELCFSLDGYGDFARSFFYQDCPGVVSSCDRDCVNSKHKFTLPGVLSVECANFFDCGEEEQKCFGEELGRLLPSELWVASNEIEEWNDYPTVYSSFVIRVILSSETIEEIDLKRFVISISSCFGIVIDLHFAEHVFSLLKLCWRAVVKEATGWIELLACGNLEEQDCPVVRSFKCPILVEVLSWLASQLAVLYGTVNARHLCVNLLKQILLQALSISLSTWLSDCPAKSVASHGTVAVDKIIGNSYSRKYFFGRAKVFLSQIVAAVTAVHERSLLEGRIRELQFYQAFPSWQRLSEHAKFLNMANEERKKRLNYRPIIEHDGLIAQRPQNQDTNSKFRTREEMLAEERDYKRRRMSYRGKKLKRSSTEVLRDIIEEHMEEIKQAGGIGCFLKGSDRGGTDQSDKHFKKTSHVDGLKIHAYCLDEFSENSEQSCVEISHPDKSRVGHNEILRSDYQKHKSYSPRLDDSIESKRSVYGERRRVHSPKSADSQKGHGRLSDRHSLGQKRTHDERRKSVHYEQSRNSSKHCSVRSYHSRYDSLRSSSVEEDTSGMGSSGSRRRNEFYRNSPVSLSGNIFEDRYDPSETHDTYDNDIVNGR